MLVVVRHQPELGPGHLVLVVRSDEAEDVLVAQHHRLVDLGLSEPALLISAGEDLHSNVLPSPPPAPDLPKSSFPNALLQSHLPGNAPLHEERIACTGSAVGGFQLQWILRRGLALVRKVGRHRRFVAGTEPFYDDGVLERSSHHCVSKAGEALAVEEDEYKDNDEDDENRN